MTRLFLSPWLSFRQAREALRLGQPDEARRILAPYVEEGYRKAITLMREVAVAYMDRADKALRADQIDVAWNELLQAEALNPYDSRALMIRNTLVRAGLNETRAALEAMNPVHAVRCISAMKERGARVPELIQLDEATHAWLTGAQQADRGEFGTARTSLEGVRTRMVAPYSQGIETYLRELDRREQRFQTALPRLYSAANDKFWKAVVESADEILSVAPDHREVRLMRAKAWEAMQPKTLSAMAADLMETDISTEIPALVGSRSLVNGAKAAQQLTQAYLGDASPRPVSRQGSTAEILLAPGAPLPTQFLLWVDGVGGYLVCLGDRVTIGQATADMMPDIPLFAPIGGLHATLIRTEEGYVLDSQREAKIQGLPTEKGLLRTEDRITLGTSCQLIFRKPTTASGTSKLEIASGHRLPWAVDGIILMDQTLILGNTEQVHIPLPCFYDDPDIAEEVTKLILFRNKDGLALKCPGKFKVDSRPCDTKADLPLPASVQTDRYSFTLEPLGPRL
ncbi:MAG: hypothetical protein ACRC8S_20980 [Fimbriiglobus sp.]